MARKINYLIGFTADASNLQLALLQALQSLRLISTLKVGLGISTDLKDAAVAASTLESALLKATNADTGKLDLSKFLQQIKSSGLTLNLYADKLLAIGPAGERAFLNLASVVSQAEIPIKRTNVLMDKLWVSMKNAVGWQITSSAIHGVMSAISSTIGYTKDLNESLTNIRIVTSSSAEEMGKFAERANEAAKMLSTTTTDYTNASLIYYQLGLNDEQVEERANATIKLANVAGESTKTASELLTAIWNNFDDGSKKLEYYADVLTALGAATASSTEEISAGILKFASVTNTIGLSYEYSAAALATITATTRESAETVGNALKTLFSRIQGLTLGETLEDGTDLNKYSKALASVGVNILDTAGKMKDMDTILDETAAKWNSLGEAQLMALAQTVGGVRQYTQFITLMEQWDFFKDNVDIAKNAEGTLQEQANIFASGWEAARKRVRAAMEDVYDSIINEDAMIDFNNNLVDVLGVIANMVDALGGLKGIIVTAGVAFTLAFGDKLAQSLRDIAYNFTVVSGKAQEAQLRIQELMGQAALRMATDSSSAANTGDILKTTILAEDILLQNMINNAAKLMTEELQAQLVNYKNIITAIKEMGAEYAGVEEKLRALTQEIERTILSLKNLITNVTFSNNLYTKLLQTLNNLKIPNLSFEGANKINLSTQLSQVEGLTLAFLTLSQSAGSLSAIKALFEALDPTLSETSIVVTNLKNEFEQLTGIDIKSMSNADSIKEVDLALLDVNNSVQLIKDLLTGVRNVSEENATALQEAAFGVGNAIQQLAHATNIAAQETQNFGVAVQMATIKLLDWASAIVNASNYMMRMGMLFLSILSIGDVISNDDLNNWERFVLITTSVGMGLSTLAPIIKMVKAERVKLTKLVVIGTGAEAEAQILASLTAKQLLLSTKVINGNTEAIIKQTVAWYASPVFWAAAAIMAVVAAWGVYTAIIETNTKRIIENAQAAADAAEERADAVKEEREEVEQLFKSYVALNSITKKSTSEKEEYTTAVEELCEALGVEWSALDKVLGKYEQVTADIAKANRESIQAALNETQEAISTLLNLMFMSGSSPTSALDFESENRKISFSTGLPFDDNDFREYLLNNLGDLVDIDDISLAASFDVNSAQDFITTYEEIKELIEEINQDEEILKKVWNSSMFQDMNDWISDNIENYKKLVEYRKEMFEYSKEQAFAEAGFLEQGFNNESALQDYQKVRDGFVEILKSKLAIIDSIPEDVDDVDAWFDDLANSIVRGYENLSQLELKYQGSKEILEHFKDHVKLDIETVQYFVDNNDYDISILLNLDWDILDDYTGEELSAKIDEAYGRMKTKLEAELYKVELPTVIDIMGTLADEGTSGLNEDMLKELDALEAKYVELNDIRNRGSAEYILALRDIREGMEHTITLDSIRGLEEAWDKVNATVKNGNEIIEATYGELRQLEKASEIEVIISGDKSNFAEVWEEILDADYEVLVAIEADLKTDIEDIVNYANEVLDAVGKIGEGFVVAYEDIANVAKVFPGILADYTITADGMILLNQEVAQSAVDLAATQIEANKEACRQDILDYYNVLMAKVAAMRTIAEGLRTLANNLTNSAEVAAEAQALIEQGLTDYHLALVDEQAFASLRLAESEVDDASQVMKADSIAAEDAATNWADAYDSMAKNSTEWAKIAIENANRVAKAVAGARNGEVIEASAISGTISSHFGGTSATVTYSGIYESGGSKKKNWLDYYDAGDYQAAYNDIMIDIATTEAAAQQLLVGLATIDGAAGAAKLAANTVGKGKDKKSGGGSKKEDKEGKVYDQEDLKTLEEIEDRYHEITREILRQDDALDDLANAVDRAYGALKLRNYRKELEALLKQLTNYEAKLKEAEERYLPQDLAMVLLLFDNVVIKDNGELANYEDLLNQVITNYNNFLAEYNAFLAEYSELTKDEQEARKEDYEFWLTQKDAAQAAYDARLAALKQYEDTRDTIQEIKDSIEETQRAIADNKLSQVEYRLEIILDVKSMRDAIRDFDKKVAGIFSDELYHGIAVGDIARDLALAEADMYPEYKKQYEDLVALYNSTDDQMDRERIMEDIQELLGKVLDSAEAIVDWVNSIEDIIPAAVDAARERFEIFTNQLEHNTTVLDTIKELYALQGVTYKTLEGFNRLLNVAQEKLEALVANSQLNRAWYEEAMAKLQEALAQLDSLGGDESNLRYDTYKKARDAYLAEFNEAQEAYLESAKEAMETAQEMYLEQIERAVYKFGLAISGGIGLDLLLDKYDHYIEKEERYLDKVNEAYEVTAWYNKLQKDIDEATNQKTKDRLKALQDEINTRREGNKLSKYDLEILNAKYEVLKAQAALEDAQENKNKMRLVRDRQGNWNYQFTADLDEVDAATQDLVDKENDWYNIAKNLVKDVTGEIISTWQECLEKIKEIYSDMTLTDQERADRAAEIYDYYTDKIKYLEEEKLVAIKDMTDAGNAVLLASAIIMGDQITDLTGLTSKDILNIVAESGEIITGILEEDSEAIKNIVAENTGLIDLFDNVYAKDLDNMTNNTAIFEAELLKTLDEAQLDFENYGDTVADVAEETGTTLEDLSDTTDQVSESTDQLRDSGLDAVDMLWDMIDATADAVEGYLDLAETIWETVEALRALAEEMADFAESQIQDFDPNLDYAALMTNYVTKGGGTIGDETYNQLNSLRNQKIASDREQYGKWDVGDEKLSSMISNRYNTPAWSQYVEGLSGSTWLDLLKRLGISGFDTGGYTGDFNNAKLAFLHEKELVLNLDDTKNILSAVELLNDANNIFSSIEKALDGGAAVAMQLMADRVSTPLTVDSEKMQIEQQVHFDSIVFPNVNSSSEIEEAFASLINDAAQWIGRKKR